MADDARPRSYGGEFVSRKEFETVMQRFDSIDKQLGGVAALLATIVDVLNETKGETMHKHVGTLLKMRSNRG